MMKHSTQLCVLLLILFLAIGYQQSIAQVTTEPDAITIERTSTLLDGFFLDMFSPTRELKVNRVGHILLRNNFSGSISDYWHFGARDNGNLDIALGNLGNSSGVVSLSNALMTFTPSGDIGIGTAEPRQELDVNGDIAITGGLKRLLYYNGSTIDATVGFVGTQKFVFDSNREGATVEINSNDDILFRVNNGVDIAMFIDENGRIATNNGAATPDSDFHIVQNAANNLTTGLRLEDNDGTSWSIWTDNGNDLAFGDNDAFRAQIEDGTGSFNITSDRRLKEDIRPMDDVLKSILKLKPSWYNYRSDKEKQLTLGFIAQDVEEHFPNFIKKAQGYKALTYDYFAVLSIKGIQELNYKLEMENKAQAEEIADLRAEMDELKQLVKELLEEKGGKSAHILTTNEVLTDARLLQNQPNPFTQNTVVRYFIPEGVKQAELRITDSLGKLIKTIQLDMRGEGQTNLAANALSAGSYQYSLILDGKLSDTKQMVLTK